MTTVLFVEDDLRQQLIVFKMLKSTGINLIFADDGLEALDKMHSCHFDLVILDIILPHVNGYEICRRLKSNQKTKNIPVLIYSNKMEECDVYWAGKQGADAFLSKLCHPQELIDTVQHLLQKKARSVGNYQESISANSIQRSVAFSIA